MDIVIVSQYLRNIEQFENNNSRFVYIAKLLAKSENNHVEIITSDFNHGKKEKFNQVGKLSGVKITVCHEKGYPKNVSLKRFISHKKLAKNIEKYLNGRKKPNIIYCAIPSLDVAKVVAKYAKRNNIRFIIDVQDLWPEAFKMVVKVPIMKDIVFYPMERKANFIYSNADEIIAVSETYADRAAKVNKKYKHKESVFLGTELSYFDKCRDLNLIKNEDNLIRIAYIGTLGHSYNIKIIIDAIHSLNEENRNKILFVVMGDGPLRRDFEAYAKEKNIRCEFTGKLDYDKMIGKLCSCDIAVNPIQKGAAQSIINKVGDYAAAGLPVINTQENIEYRTLVDEYKIGMNCANNDAKDIADKIMILCQDKALRQELGKNNRKLAEEKFDRAKTYRKIVNLVEEDD